MWQLVILSDSPNSQTDSLLKSARKSGIKSIGLFTGQTGNRITISGGEIIINGRETDPNAVALFTQFSHEFAGLPLIGKANDFTIFQDQYPVSQQSASHLLSLGSVHGNGGGHVINNPLKTADYYTSVFTLDLLRSNGIKTIDYLFANNLKALVQSPIGGHEAYYWSYIIPNSPVKYINRKTLAKLFDSSHELPFLIFPYRDGGLYLRMWFFRDEPLIGCHLTPPEYTGEYKGLEKYRYFLPHPSMQKLAEEIFSITALDFYEVRALVNIDTGELGIITIDPDPYYYSLEKNLCNYITAALLNKFMLQPGLAGRRTPTVPEPDINGMTETRTTSLLTRMLETQLIIHRSEGMNDD